MYVLSGDLLCGDVHCPASIHIDLPHGAALGTLIAGPDGVELFEVMMGDAASWAADPDCFKALLASRNITKLPDPPH